MLLSLIVKSSQLTKQLFREYARAYTITRQTTEGALVEEKLAIRQLFARVPKGPFNKTLVLEIGGNVSGPIASSELARKGSLVIKLEQKGIGDPARSYLPSKGKPNAIFTSLNAAKASIAFSPEDKEDYRSLLQLADVIIDNRSPDAKNRDEVLQSFLKDPAKPHPVIFCSIVGYDSKTFHYRSAWDTAVQAWSGMAAVNASSPNSPLKVGFTLIDITTGLQAASEIKDSLFMLRDRDYHPHNHSVIDLEVSMAKVAANLLVGQYLTYKSVGIEPARKGNRDIFVAPFSFYNASDGLISLSVICGKSEAPFKTLCEKVLECPELAQKYNSNANRLANIDAFEEELNAIISKKTKQEWVDLCLKHGVVCSVVNTVAQALQDEFAPSMFSRTVDGTPIVSRSGMCSAFPEEPLSSAPLIDEHRPHIQSLLKFCSETHIFNFNRVIDCFNEEEQDESSPSPSSSTSSS